MGDEADLALDQAYDDWGRQEGPKPGQETLKAWSERSKILPTMPTTEKGAVSVTIGIFHEEWSALWILSDYVVTSASGSVVWLMPRSKPAMAYDRIGGSLTVTVHDATNGKQRLITDTRGRDSGRVDTGGGTAASASWDFLDSPP